MQSYGFSKYTEDGSSKTAINTTFTCDDDSTWIDVMRQFAVFLDNCGYFNVSETIESLLTGVEDD